MCYYNGIRVTHGEYFRLKQLAKLITTSINISVLEGPLYAPDTPYPVLKAVEGKEDFELVNMEWGFLPSENRWPFLKDREQIYKWRKGFSKIIFFAEKTVLLRVKTPLPLVLHLSKLDTFNAVF